ncbi:hypothetical protein BGY98DRAFT_944118, partial [Russula aff. rugulosa BPL654]
MLSLMVGLLPFPGYPLAVPPFPLKPEGDIEDDGAGHGRHRGVFRLKLCILL